ncbi:3071_t:CDS:2 [Diversispora eburnea]|uniref:3071_t:CDS:1 n=1 Tax=Diversispora eburnea TaxID=1213867 RepID=A0A9N9F2I3_9GLOM|nr:3071_t:CDS:2 [Diversispora eburnea]
MVNIEISQTNNHQSFSFPLSATSSSSHQQFQQFRSFPPPHSLHSPNLIIPPIHYHQHHHHYHQRLNNTKTAIHQSSSSSSTTSPITPITSSSSPSPPFSSFITSTATKKTSPISITKVHSQFIRIDNYKITFLPTNNILFPKNNSRLELCLRLTENGLSINMNNLMQDEVFIPIDQVNL